MLTVLKGFLLANRYLNWAAFCQMRGPAKAEMGEGRSITVAAQFAITRSVFFIFVFLYAQFGKVASYHFRSFFRLAIRCAKSDRSRVLGGKGGVGGRDRTGRTCGRMRGSENRERLNERTNERAGVREEFPAVYHAKQVAVHRRRAVIWQAISLVRNTA